MVRVSSFPPLQLTAIGVVHSPWLDKRSAPRQPAAARGVSGRIELFPAAELQDALSDLDTWSHIWVLFWFHLNAGFHAKVEPPRSRKKRGVFATRSPYRPNPLGLSALRLLGVEGRVLHVSDLDIVDGTPVLDIKPYVAYSDAVRDANSGWLGEQQELAEGPQYQVDFGARAAEQLAWLAPRSAFDLGAHIVSVLSAGPAPHAYRRIRELETHSVLAAKDFRAHFRVVANLITVFEITSGYRTRVLDDPAAVATEHTPLSVHREFRTRFGHPVG